MLHIILLILKIIGIILLVLFGILLFLLLTVLFIPIRYRVRASHGESIQIEGRISWFLHMIHAEISQLDEDRHIQLRIFGFIIYDNKKPVKPKKVKKKQHRRARGKKKRVTPVSKKERYDFKEEKSVYHSGEELKNKTIHLEEYQNDKEKPEDTINEEENEVIFQKFFLKVKTLILGIKGFFIRLMRKIKHIFLAIFNIKHKISLVKEFFQDENNREAIKACFHSIKKLLKHIFPTKLKSRVVFGTGDPCSTGQALGAFSILYSFYGDNIQIVPDFENKIFEGNHYARGRIRLFTILIIVIKLIINKKFKQLMRNFKILKEAL